MRLSVTEFASTLAVAAPYSSAHARIMSLPSHMQSYGTPNDLGGCSYSLSSCNAATSGLVVSSACVGSNSCSVGATNANFGNPCIGA